MRVALIYAKSQTLAATVDEAYQDTKRTKGELSRDEIYPALGILTLAAELERIGGYEVRIIDDSIEDDETIVIPDRPGNKLAYGHENVLANPHVGLLCLIPGTSETLRINGRAELTAAPELLERLAARGRPAVLATRVRIDQCFFHCGKAFIRSNLWKPEKWGERHRVSFGEMLGPRTGGGADAVKTIDAIIESDYRDNL